LRQEHDFYREKWQKEQNKKNGFISQEQYAAMEAGGGAVAAPPKQGELADRPAAGRRGRNSVRAFWARFSVFFCFSSFSSSHQKGGFPKKGGRAQLIRNA
jgi:hypothetical protein